MSSVDALKAEGNKAFSAKNYDLAIELFTKAIELDANNHVLWSNRSAAKAGKRQYEGALEDAEQCIKVNPTWAKGYARKGAALHGERRYAEAVEAYETGLKIEDSDALRKGLKEVKEAKEADERGDGAEAMGLAKMFGDPNLIGKLAANPRTQKHLADASFMQTLLAIQKNPQLANTALQGDPRMIDVLGVLMGIDMQGFTRPEDSDALKGMNTQDMPDILQQPSSPPRRPATPPQPKASTSAPPKPAQEDVNMTEPETEEDAEEARLKKEAEAEKKIGSEAYKKRDFETASKHFEKAWELWPKDITFLTNLGAVYFEQGEYDKTIEACEKAAEEARSLRADYKLVAKAYGRIGSAYQRKNDLGSAIKYYEKSLTEHRTPDILNKLRDVQKEKAELDRQAYIDPEKAEVAREEGNKLFKNGDFAGAVKSYTEGIKRNPSDPRGYNNRALAYTKLVAFPEALKDAEEAIKVDPTFVKAYIRKSTVHFAMRDYTKAMDAIQEATEHDDDAKHTSEIQSQMFKIQQALSQQRAGESDQEALERAMRDPEVAGIMNDPVMQSILQQAQSNPQALQDHMKNPTVKSKIMKLINAGIIKTRTMAWVLDQDQSLRPASSNAWVTPRAQASRSSALTPSFTSRQPFTA
ncbi:hypothetical protein EVG20_g7325 [Dentipellis fragilis]|uniref:STI1 domain-containing protein n=1 Tax=Dentipellis fragilis TaxID=205917 RepID=A0A4Y9YGL6_9AGAM|nr:hypothetical protein EVG20_g7325 [Dentipellis fragilis]